MRIEWTKSATKDLRKIPAIDKVRILVAVERLAGWPVDGDIKAMKGKPAGRHRLRVGEYRVIFEVKDNVLIIRVASRGSVYE
ncbi:MAG: type II toxin-antitoxin system RelE/ParE family toxin [Polyangiaceae bacterium]